MGLPKLTHPTIEVKIPSTKKPAVFRPYTVKEQKILLMLKEAGSPEEVTSAVQQIIESCSVNPIDTSKLSYFDIEFIFLKIRAFSVGETSTVNYRCNNTVGTEPCGKVTAVEVDLNSIQVDFTGAKSQEIQCEAGITLRLKYPTLKSAAMILDYRMNNNLESLIEAIVSDVDLVSDSEKVYDDFTEEELKEFVNSLSISTFEKILDFYIQCPTLKKDVMFKCSKCGYQETIQLRGIQDFFE